MNRVRALKVVLGLVGLIFLASGYPLVIFVRQDPALSMMFSLYVTLGNFPAAGGSQPLGKSQFDSLHRMVELRSRGRHGRAGIS